MSILCCASHFFLSTFWDSSVLGQFHLNALQFFRVRVQPLAEQLLLQALFCFYVISFLASPVTIFFALSSDSLLGTVLASK